MRQAHILLHNKIAGILTETNHNKAYRFEYSIEYTGNPVSLTMPIKDKTFEFDKFPPFLEGLLPEGPMLESLLTRKKFDRNDRLSQIIQVGNDLVGAITVKRKK